jgi:spermidine synthase
MPYRKLRLTRPPFLFQLQLKAGLARLAAAGGPPAVPAALRHRLEDYVESVLLADNLPPKDNHISLLTQKFADLVALSESGKPFVYLKRHSVSLLFDVCAIQSEMYPDAPDELVLGYTQAMMGFLLFNPRPAHIAMIGLGGGSLAKYCHRYLPESRIAVAENDADVIALRAHFRVPGDSARFRVLCEDGADFVRRPANAFDVLMVDGFDRRGQPPQLCSQRFYDDCHAALAPDGILVANLLGDVLETAACLDRMRLSFDGAVVVIDDGESLNKIAFACKGGLLEAPDRILRRRLAELEKVNTVKLAPILRHILANRRAGKDR